MTIASRTPSLMRSLKKVSGDHGIAQSSTRNKPAPIRKQREAGKHRAVHQRAASTSTAEP